MSVSVLISSLAWLKIAADDLPFNLQSFSAESSELPPYLFPRVKLTPDAALVACHNPPQLRHTHVCGVREEVFDRRKTLCPSQ